MVVVGIDLNDVGTHEEGEPAIPSAKKALGCVEKFYVLRGNTDAK